MGPRAWLYGQRSRSNPASHPGSLDRPRIDEFRPRIDRTGVAQVSASAVEPSLDRTDAVLDHRCVHDARRELVADEIAPPERRSPPGQTSSTGGSWRRSPGLIAALVRRDAGLSTMSDERRRRARRRRRERRSRRSAAFAAACSRCHEACHRRNAQDDPAVGLGQGREDRVQRHPRRVQRRGPHRRVRRG
jgi:hypothetical protein